LADVNGDGRKDAVVTAADGRVWTRLGKADGTFGEVLAAGIGLVGSNNLVKTSGAGWWDAGASSAESLTGAGYVQMVVAETNTERMLGLSYSDPDPSQVTFTYGIYLAGN